jgi:hypothetical protein
MTVSDDGLGLLKALLSLMLTLVCLVSQLDQHHAAKEIL